MNNGTTREAIAIDAALSPSTVNINGAVKISVMVEEVTLTNLIYCGTVQCGEK